MTAGSQDTGVALQPAQKWTHWPEQAAVIIREAEAARIKVKCQTGGSYTEEVPTPPPQKSMSKSHGYISTVQAKNGPTGGSPDSSCHTVERDRDSRGAGRREGTRRTAAPAPSD